MSNRHTSRRPNRRQIDKTTLYISPLALQYATPGIDAGNTFFTLALTEFSARVSNATATPEAARITLTGTFPTGFDTVECDLVRNDGEDGAGTIVTFGFPGELDATAPWELAIPADTPLIQGRFGGRLAGAYSIGELLTDSLGGFIRMTNLEDGPFAGPPLMWVTGIAYTDPDVFYDVQLSETADPITIVGLPPMNSSSAGPASSVVDQGGGVLRVTFPVAPGPGAVLDFPEWNASIKGFGGQWLAPFSQVVP